MNSILKKEKSLYFRSIKNYLKCRLLKEHEYYIWRYIIFLRREESSKINIFKLYWRKKKNMLGAKLGITIYADVFDEGLHIWHYGNIVVNGYSKVGKNCVLHGDNCIGNNGKSDEAPIIGNNVDIGVGAKIIGNVTIADDIRIGAGAVVINSFYEKGITIGGVPARKLR